MDNTKLLRHQLWPCVLVSHDQAVRIGFARYELEHCGNIFSKKTIYQTAIEKKKHFLENRIAKNFPLDILPDPLNQIVCLLKLIANIDHPRNDEKSLIQLNAIEANVYTGSLSHILLFELRRLYNMQNVLIYHISNYKCRLPANNFNIIDYLIQQLDISKFDYDTMRAVLVDNHRNNSQITELIDDKVEHNVSKELELYDQFSIIKLFVEIIMMNHNAEDFEEVVETKIRSIKVRLRNVQRIAAYITVLEASYALLFMRWDHVRTPERVELDRTIESGSESDRSQDESRKKSTKYEQFGFVCSADVLETVLTILRSSSTQKRHSDDFQEASTYLQDRFMGIYKRISNAEWRMSLFKSQPDSGMSAITMDVRKLLRQHVIDLPTRTSSDDDGDQPIQLVNTSARNASLLRRKPRKKHPFRKPDGEKSISFSHSTENERKSGDAMSRSISMSNKRCLVSKMLGPPEQLITVCMAKGDLSEARQIIKVCLFI